MANESISTTDLPLIADSYQKDLLKTDEIALVIEREIRAAKSHHSGLTIGIYGRWGSGKSTLMRLLQQRLKISSDKKRFMTVWFSAWKYDKQEDVWIAFLQEILHDIESHLWLPKRALLHFNILRTRLNESVISRLIIRGFLYLIIASFISFLLYLQKDSLYSGVSLLMRYLQGTQATEIDKLLEPYKKIVESSKLILGPLFALVSYLFFLVPKFFRFIFGKLDVELAELVKKDPNDSHAIFIDKVINDFHVILNSVGKNKTVVVFIDDLDRCSSVEQINDVLGAIKQFTMPMEVIKNVSTDPKDDLKPPKIIFILGADRSMIEHAAARQYEQVKAPNSNDIESITSSKDIGKNYLEKIVQISFDLPVSDTGRVKTYIEGLIDKSKVGFTKENINFFSSTLPSNPRQIKRVLNAHLLSSRMARGTKIDKGDNANHTNVLIPLLALLRYEHEEVYQLLGHYPTLLGELVEFAYDKYEGQEEIAALGCPTATANSALIVKHGLNNPRLISQLSQINALVEGSSNKNQPPDKTHFSPKHILKLLHLDEDANLIKHGQSDTTADFMSGDPSRINWAVQSAAGTDSEIRITTITNLMVNPDPEVIERAIFTLPRITKLAHKESVVAIEITEGYTADKNLKLASRAIYALGLFGKTEDSKVQLRAVEILVTLAENAKRELPLRILALSNLSNTPLTSRILERIVEIGDTESNNAIAEIAKRCIEVAGDVSPDLSYWIDSLNAILASAKTDLTQSESLALERRLSMTDEFWAKILNHPTRSTDLVSAIAETFASEKIPVELTDSIYEKLELATRRRSTVLLAQSYFQKYHDANLSNKVRNQFYDLLHKISFKALLALTKGIDEAQQPDYPVEILDVLIAKHQKNSILNLDQDSDQDRLIVWIDFIKFLNSQKENFGPIKKGAVEDLLARLAEDAREQQKSDYELAKSASSPSKKDELESYRLRANQLSNLIGKI